MVKRTDSMRRYDHSQIKRQRRTRNEALVYDSNNDYPIQELLEWLSDGNFTSDKPAGADVKGFRKRLEHMYIYLNDDVIQPALRTFGYVHDSMTSRRQYLTASEKKECREALQDVFDEFERANQSLINDKDRKILHDKAFGDDNGNIKKSSAFPNSENYYITSMLRKCRDWVYDSKKDNDEVSFYSMDLIDLFDELEDISDDVYIRANGSDAGYFLSPDIPFVLEDSTLPNSLEIFKKSGKVTVNDFEEALDELERVDGTTESQFEFSFEALDNEFGNIMEDTSYEDVFNRLCDIWEQITQTIEGYPAYVSMRIRRH